MQKDITTKEDIALLVDTFYSRVMKDPDLAPFFEGMDFDHHKPRMIHFWSFALLNEPGYTTNVFDKHAHLPLQKQHFEKWLMWFELTVNELFAGPVANDALLRAKTIGYTFASKMAQRGEG